MRYTVALMAITSGSTAARRTKDSNVPLNDSYGCWTSRSARVISENMSPVSAALAKRGGTIGTQGSSFSSGRSSAAIWPISDRSIEPETV